MRIPKISEESITHNIDFFFLEKKRVKQRKKRKRKING